ncbi:MAG: hypothetical protein AABW80_00590 [Nanoarchaeota archaeon]
MDEENFRWQRNAVIDSGVLEYVAFHTDEGLQIREAVVRKPKEILFGDNKIKIAFLTAFFNDEGSISNDGRIMGDLKNEIMIKQIISMLREFDLPFKMIDYKEKNGLIYKIYLPKKLEYLERFQQLNLFDKSIITHGKNILNKKENILKVHVEKLKNPI